MLEGKPRESLVLYDTEIEVRYTSHDIKADWFPFHVLIQSKWSHAYDSNKRVWQINDHFWILSRLPQELTQMTHSRGLLDVSQVSTKRTSYMSHFTINNTRPYLRLRSTISYDIDPLRQRLKRMFKNWVIGLKTALMISLSAHGFFVSFDSNHHLCFFLFAIDSFKACWCFASNGEQAKKWGHSKRNHSSTRVDPRW